MIEIRNVSKIYETKKRKVTGVDNVTLTINKGDIFGISILLFGIIASSGLRMLVDSKVDFGNNRNMVIASVILVIGIGGAALRFSESFAIEGMALAAIIGVVLNLILPGRETKVEDYD